LSDSFAALFEECRGAFHDRRVFERARVLAQASILSLGRRTVAGTLTACGRLFEDWSATYRVFERERFDADSLFATPRRAAVRSLPPRAPVVVVMDDTLVPKRDRNVVGAAWRHDSRGPAFQHQIVWSQRVLQISAILPSQSPAAQGARAIPIDLQLQTVVPKPRKPDAEHKAHWRKEKRRYALPALGARRIHHLRNQLDADGENNRLLVTAFDGGYTNKANFRDIPERTVLVGRIRKDAKLFAVPPEQPKGRGRRRLYGQELAKPEALLRDESIEWKKTRLFAAGKMRQFQYKTVGPCRWQGAGGRDLRLVLVRPLSATPRDKGRRLFFANPGYLLCSDPKLPIKTIVQAYLWRWEIEVGFREQKTQLGLGEAQVRTLPAVKSVLAFQACLYALLLLAAQRSNLQCPPRPKWQRPANCSKRITLGQMIAIMRTDLWGRALGVANKRDFNVRRPPGTKSPKIADSLDSAVIYAMR